jgi:outer membrane lipoprotein-sorting protein
MNGNSNLPRGSQPVVSQTHRRRLAALTVALACLSFLSPPSAPASSEPVQSLTVAQVLARVYTARGGLVRLRALQSQRVSGTISFGNDASGPFFVEFRRPLKMHMELTIQNQTVIRIFDGTEGWANNPFTGKVNPEPMSEEDLKNINEEADFEGPLVDYRKKGNKLELVGKDKVEDKDVWRVQLTTKSGDVRYYLFDAGTFLLLKWEGKRQVQGKATPIQSYYRDYREVGGMKFAFAIDSGSSPTDLTQKIIIEKIELNPQVPESQFAKPAAPGETPTPAPPSR